MNTEFNILEEDTRHGRMLFNENDIYVGQALERYGEYSEHEVKVFEFLLRPGDVVVEVGANIGAHTLPLSRLAGEVHAFEPQRIIFQTLCANMALNSITNVYCYPCGIGSQKEIVRLPAIDYTHVANYGAVQLKDKQGGERVEVWPLDKLRFPWVHLLKIDVEGMELEVIRGAYRTIKQYHPIIWVENDRQEKSQDLIELLWSYEYDLYFMVTPLFNADNYYGVEKNIYPDTVSCNMLCVPGDVEINIDGEKVDDSSYHPLRKEAA